MVAAIPNTAPYGYVVAKIEVGVTTCFCIHIICLIQIHFNIFILQHTENTPHLSFFLLPFS